MIIKAQKKIINIFSTSKSAIKRVQGFKINIKKVNHVISIISSYSIFFGIFLFLIGSVGRLNIVEDDLLLNDIKKQLPKNSKISSVLKDDIHGFGNETIIVSAVNRNKNFDNVRQSPNQLFIYDKVENDILRYLYRPLGIGSSYHLKYKLSLSDNEGDVMLNDLDDIKFIDLTGDMFKEVIATFNSIGASDGVDLPCIISWIDGSYRFIGSFPSGYEDYLENTESLKNDLKKTHTQNELYYWNASARDEKIYLNGCMRSFNWFFLDADEDGNDELIVCAWQWRENESRGSEHFYRIDIYKPSYDSAKSNFLEWDLLFSKGTSEKIEKCDLDFVKKFIAKYKNEIY